MNHAKWIAHFERNSRNRPEPDWQAPYAPLPAAVVRSVEQFRLGDGGGPACLIAYDAERFRGTTPERRRLVDLWFQEEAEHARLLGGAVRRFGGRIITWHWSFGVFCFVRRWGGVRFELQALTLTELVSTAYYRLLRRHSPDGPLAAMCDLILRDEAGHVAFHRDRLAGAGGWWWRWQFTAFGYAAATMLWINHAPGLKAIGGTRREFYRETTRQLTRFVRRLRRASESTWPLVAKPVTIVADR